MTEGHIVPGLANSSLISTSKFCDSGCRVAFDEEECRVYYKGELVLEGGRDEHSGMWKLPINPINKNNDNTYLDLAPTNKGAGHTATNLYTLPYKQQQLKYMHHAFFNPLIATIIDAANNNELHGIPFLGKPELVRRYLAPSAATAKGRMKRQRANTRTTRAKVRQTQKDETTIPENQCEGEGYNIKGHKGDHWIQPVRRSEEPIHDFTIHA